MPLRAITGRGSSRRVQGSLIRLRTVTAMRLLAKNRHSAHRPAKRRMENASLGERLNSDNLSQIIYLCIKNAIH
jgi:hypothetical protein